MSICDFLWPEEGLVARFQPFGKVDAGGQKDSWKGSVYIFNVGICRVYLTVRRRGGKVTSMASRLPPNYISNFGHNLQLRPQSITGIIQQRRR